MDKTIKPGCRVVERDGGSDPIKADVLKVSKDGKRARVQFALRGLRDGELHTMWTSVTMWEAA